MFIICWDFDGAGCIPFLWEAVSMSKIGTMSGKKRQLRSLAAVSLILLLVTGLIFGASLLRQAGGEEALLAAGRALYTGDIRQKVIVDAGHGGFDGGAIGIGGVIEKNLNLSFSLPAGDFLAVMGYIPVLTRTEDTGLDNGESTIREKKRADLQARLKMMSEDVNVPVIMIHQNKFTQSQYSGAQMFYGTQNPASKQMAEQLRSGIVRYLQPDNTRELKKATSDVWLLVNCPAPVVMVECGFISNPEECALLQQPEYQRKFAFVLAASLDMG